MHSTKPHNIREKSAPKNVQRCPQDRISPSGSIREDAIKLQIVREFVQQRQANITNW